MRIARLVLALVLTAGLMLVGLGSMGPKASAQQAGKVIRFGVNRAAENLDPVTQDANPDIWAFTQIYQQLVRVNVKGDGFEPDLAEKWTHVGRRPDVDVLPQEERQASRTATRSRPATRSGPLKRARDTKGPWKWALEAVEDIQAKDDYTVVISLKEPWAPFLADISLFSNSIMPEKVFKDAKDEDFANKPVGSGPFMLVDWKKGEELVMKANPHYYEKGVPKSHGASHPVHPGRQQPASSRSSPGTSTASTTRPSPASRSSGRTRSSRRSSTPPPQVSHLSLNIAGGAAQQREVPAGAGLRDRPGRDRQGGLLRALHAGDDVPADDDPVLQQGLEGQRLRPQQGQAAPQGVRASRRR